MADLLLTTKLQIPPVRPNLVTRARLFAQLDGGLVYPLMLVSAPPGFGKTTIVSEWASHLSFGISALRLAAPERNSIPNPKSQSQNRVAWLALTDEDNDVVRFLTYVSTAVDQWNPGLADMALALLGAPQPPAPRTIVTILINALSQLPASQAAGYRSYVLVLDDYHLIHATAIHEAVAFLVEHSPPQFHLLITSRVDPPLPLATWRARGQLAELRAADLRFTLAEAAQFLNETMGLTLAPEDGAALEMRTEGWVAGLQLAALALRGRSDHAAFLAQFTGSHRYILGYLMDEVLARQPAAVQDFLLKTAVLEQLCGALCDAVTGETGSQARLEELQRTNLFTVALDEQGEWYRYHHLFRDVLRLRLQQTQADLIPTLQQRASRWYEAEGRLDEAIEYAVAAQDLQRAGDLIANAFLPLWKRSALGTLRGWIEQLPEAAFQQHAELAFWSGALLGYTGQLDLAENRLNLAETLFQAAAASQDLPPDVLVERQGRVAWLRGVLAGRRGAVDQTLAFVEQAFRLLPPNELLFRGGTFVVLGLAYVARGELVAAQAAYEQAADRARATEHWFLLNGALGRLAPIQVTLGRLHAAVASCRQLLALPIVQRGGLPAAGFAHVGLAEVFYQWNELDEALAHATQGLALGETAHIADLIYAALLIQSRVQTALGAREAAFALLQGAYAIAPQVGGAQVVRRVQALEALTQLRFGQSAATTRWARSLTPLATSDLLLSELEGLVQARLYLAETQPAAALHPLQSLLLAAETAERLSSVIEILVLQARAQSMLGQRELALDTVERVLALAEPEGYVRIFVDEGPPMRKLIAECGVRNAEWSARLRAYADKLLAAFDQAKAATKAPETPPTLRTPHSPLRTLVEPLTEREQAVLNLVAEGASNEQIATTLVISIHTVRKHVSNILAKLAVASRTEAVARARQFGLL